MTLPLDPNQPIGETEFSHGPGMFPHPQSNFQTGKLPFPEPVPEDDNVRDLIAYRRLDSTVADETINDMLFAKGNPDRFGDQAPLVTAPPNVSQKPIENTERQTRVRRDG